MTEIPAGQEILSVIGGPAKTTSDVVVELVDVSKSFGDLEVLRGVNLSVRGSECVCVIGPSGSGKSTLLRCINYLEDIDASGSVTVNGQRMGVLLARRPSWVKAREGGTRATAAGNRHGLPAVQPLPTHDRPRERDRPAPFAFVATTVARPGRSALPCSHAWASPTSSPPTPTSSPEANSSASRSAEHSQCDRP